MNNNTVKITVTDNRGDLVLATTSETYAADLQNNKEKLNVWWRCNVEYDNGKVGYDYPCNHNGKKPRKVIFVNGRLIYADYNFSIEGVENVCDTLEEMFDIDFKSNEQPKELLRLNNSIFVVIDEFVYQMENGVFVKVFLNYKSAKKCFDDTVKERKKNDHLFVDLEDEDLVVEESENSLCAYRDGCYCTDHINISIEEQEVID